MENAEGTGERMDDEERAFLDETRTWYGSGEGRDIDATVILLHEEAPRLHHAARHGWCSAIRWLLEHGADVVVRTSGGWPPLFIAACYDRCDAAVLLLDAGARVDARWNRFGRDLGPCNTALHWAVRDSRIKMCKLLLSRGASLDARNKMGQDPEAHSRFCDNSHNAAFLADVRAAGGWSAYVAAPRNQLLALRRELPTRFRTGPCNAPRAQARLFLDKKIPDDVFIHTLMFWRSERDV